MEVITFDFVTLTQVTKLYLGSGLVYNKRWAINVFHKVPVGEIEQNQPLFKRADLGKYLGIWNIKDIFKELSLHHTHPRYEIEGVGHTDTLGRAKNPHDIFINLDGSIEIVVRSKKHKVVASVKWPAKKRLEKIQAEHQQAIEEKDAALAHRDDQIEALELTNETSVPSTGNLMA